MPALLDLLDAQCACFLNRVTSWAFLFLSLTSSLSQECACRLFLLRQSLLFITPWSEMRKREDRGREDTMVRYCVER